MVFQTNTSSSFTRGTSRRPPRQADVAVEVSLESHTYCEHGLRNRPPGCRCRTASLLGGRPRHAGAVDEGTDVGGADAAMAVSPVASTAGASAVGQVPRRSGCFAVGALWPQYDFDNHGAAEIACRYQQPGHAVPMHLFVSEVTAADAEADLLGLGRMSQGTLIVERLPGDHVTMLELPVVEQLAQTMRESLRKAKGSTRVGRPAAAATPSPAPCTGAARGGWSTWWPTRGQQSVLCPLSRISGCIMLITRL
jgi:hypothetical protein